MTDDSAEDDDFDELFSDPETEIEIPPLFYSEETRQSFETCIDCGVALLEPNAEDDRVYYQVHKVFVRNEAVFEFAICSDCQECLRQEFSEETAAAIMEFCREHLSAVDLIRRGSFEECIESCFVCKRPRNECHRYSLSGMMAGRAMLLSQGPHVLCEDCESNIGELISQETRDSWDRFVNDHFDAPPGVEVDDWDRTPMLI